jgi:haloalkane dehalogenase
MRQQAPHHWNVYGDSPRRDGLKVLRTPEDRFTEITTFDYEPHYTDIFGLWMHHVAVGPTEGAPVLLLHGEPTWCFLYRRMLPMFATAGQRAIAPDFIGFGRSDKPAGRSAYSYQAHLDWMHAWLEELDLREITLVCQDWGALIGLRLLAEHPERFARVIVSNGFLPTGDRRPPWPFFVWQLFARWSPWFPAGRIVQVGTVTRLPPAIIAAYNAPFPNEAYKAGARAFPQLVPTCPDDPAAPANRLAWDRLRGWTKPFLTAFTDRDPFFRGLDRVLQRHVPGAKGQLHVVLRGGGHFVQEDCGPELAQVTLDFIAKTAHF